MLRGGEATHSSAYEFPAEIERFEQFISFMLFRGSDFLDGSLKRAILIISNTIIIFIRFCRDAALIIGGPDVSCWRAVSKPPVWAKRATVARCEMLGVNAAVLTYHCSDVCVTHLAGWEMQRLKCRRPEEEYQKKAEDAASVI